MKSTRRQPKSRLVPMLSEWLLLSATSHSLLLAANGSMKKRVIRQERGQNLLMLRLPCRPSGSQTWHPRRTIKAQRVAQIEPLRHYALLPDPTSFWLSILSKSASAFAKGTARTRRSVPVAKRNTRMCLKRMCFAPVGMFSVHRAPRPW